jgi:hypothetical protein
MYSIERIFLTLDLGTAFAAITMVRDISDEELLFLNMQSKTQFVNHKDFLSVLEILLE